MPKEFTVAMEVSRMSPGASAFGRDELAAVARRDHRALHPQAQAVVLGGQVEPGGAGRKQQRCARGGQGRERS
jgi:hypothetical protein